MCSENHSKWKNLSYAFYKNNCFKKELRAGTSRKREHLLYFYSTCVLTTFFPYVGGVGIRPRGILQIFRCTTDGLGNFSFCLGKILICIKIFQKRRETKYAGYVIS